MPAHVVVEHDGPVLRVTGLHRGFVSTGPDIGVDGTELDALIARQRDHFAARGEAVEWKTRAHDRPADVTDRLLAAGFVPEDRETVVVAAVDDLATDDSPPAPGCRGRPRPRDGRPRGHAPDRGDGGRGLGSRTRPGSARSWSGWSPPYRG